MVIYHTSNIVFLYGYDFWSDYQTSRRCKILTKSTNADKLKNLLENLEPMLDALK
tara:strand:- start:1449 stop:1613 length:165 start_codon:yes stop_codon:yes gene_type:complete